MGNFVHLHLHSEYSLLDGACRIKDIPKAAKAAGHDAVAITDHGAMYGVVEFYRACLSEGVKPIIGCEVYVAPRSRFDRDGKRDSSGHHLVLLVKNETGYKNLTYLVSAGFTEGFYSKPRVDKELLRAHSDGLIALSACLAGEIPRLILDGNIEEADACASEMQGIFGKGNFYLEIQDHSIPDERTVALALADMSKRLGIPLVATNDVHYLKKSDADTQAILMCIQTNNVISDGRPIGFETDEFYYKSTDEMRALFGAFNGALENTVKIADECNFDFVFGEVHLPTYRPENGESPEKYLRSLAEDGLAARIKNGDIDLKYGTPDDYRSRLEYELGVIHSMGFDEYYLIVRDFIAFAKRSGIPVGPGRGSGAGSLVAYCVHITEIDPLRFGLLFERFLNPERVSLPDFDTDFCYERRDEVIEYVRERYGRDHVAQIVTFGTMAARAAVRDVGRALGMSYSDTDRVARLIPHDLKITIADALKNKELHDLTESDPQVKRLIEIAQALEGMPRHASTHAAGVVITEKPTYEYVPLSVNGDCIVTEFDMNTVADLGLVKFDFLGLRYLTIIADAEKNVRERLPDFNIEKIPLDDAASYKLISDGQVGGIFQLESSGMRQMLMQLKPENIEDIIAAIALYRPGPMDSIPKYIACRHGETEVSYPTPLLRDILGETYGCIVYQEQVMQIFRSLADYSFARADLVRRAMAKKKSDVMEAERKSFIFGAEKNGITRETASGIFDDMVSFASYAFNKSHAAAYAMLSYRTAYLKRHFTKEYMAALMTSVLGQAGKLAEYIEECRKFGIAVLAPNINESRKNFSVAGDHIRFGMLALKNVGEKFIESIISERTANGRFTSFENFVERMSGSDMNKRQIESLIKCGAFDGLGVRRSQLLATYEAQIDNASSRARSNLGGQIDMFSSGGTSSIKSSFIYPDIPEFSTKELLMLEKESSGMFFSGHMLDDYSLFCESVRHDDISQIIASFSSDTSDGKYREKQSVSIVGLVGKRINKNTRSGGAMAFVTIEDRYSEIEVVVFPKQLEKYSSQLLPDNALYICGTISSKEGEAPKILLNTLEVMDSNAAYAAKHTGTARSNSSAGMTSAKKKAKCVYLRVESMDDIRTLRAIEYSRLHQGDCELVLFDRSRGKYSAARSIGVDASEDVVRMLKMILGEENVVVK